MGFEEIEVTSRARDGGIDVRGISLVRDVIRARMAVQVKRWKRNVQAPVVQQVRGSLGVHERGLIIMTSNFSKGVREEADRKDATPRGTYKRRAAGRSYGGKRGRDPAQVTRPD